MAARIVNLGEGLSRPQGALGTAPLGLRAYRVPGDEPPREQHVWRGASGRGYQHTVYGLIECPPLPAAGYVLVRRDAQGGRVALRVGLGSNDAPTLNLAEIRQSGARIGANEVHVLIGGCEAERRLVACDLRAGLFGSLAAEPTADA